MVKTREPGEISPESAEFRDSSLDFAIVLLLLDITLDFGLHIGLVLLRLALGDVRRLEVGGGVSLLWGSRGLLAWLRSGLDPLRCGLLLLAGLLVDSRQLAFALARGGCLATSRGVGGLHGPVHLLLNQGLQ